MSERMTRKKDVIYGATTRVLIEIRDLLETQNKLLVKIDRGVRVGRRETPTGNASAQADIVSAAIVRAEEMHRDGSEADEVFDYLWTELGAEFGFFTPSSPANEAKP